MGNPYLFLATHFVYNYTHYQAIFVKKSTAVKDHMLFCDHIVSTDDFKILATSDSDFHVKVEESLLISCDEPILNKNETSRPLYLFD